MNINTFYYNIVLVNHSWKTSIQKQHSKQKSKYWKYCKCMQFWLKFLKYELLKFTFIPGESE